MKFHAAKFCPPQPLGRRTDAVEVKGRHLRIHVRDSVLFAYRRKSYLHDDGIGRGSEVEDGFQSSPFYALGIFRRSSRGPESAVGRRILFPAIERVTRHCRGKANCEIELSSRSPASRLSHPGHGSVPADTYAR